MEAVRKCEALPGVFGGVLFTRMPLTLPEKPEWERDHLDWQTEWHAKAGKWREWPEWLEKGDFHVGGGESASLEEAAVEARSAAPLEQDADVSGDRRTVQRRLDRHLYLLLKRKDKGTGGEGGEWFFPHVAHNAAETIRQTCERALETYVELGGEGGKGSTTHTFFIGNGPCGMLPVEAEEEGGKIFLIPVELIRGSPKLNKTVRNEVADFAWVARDEMKEYFKDEETQEYLSMLLQDKSDYYGPGTSQTY
jgi:large subunit ribosomal protein L46